MKLRRLIVTCITAAIVTSSGGDAIAARSERTGTMHRTYPSAAESNEGRWRGPCDGWQYGETLTSPAIFNANPIRNRIRIMRLVTCVFDWLAPGNAATAVYVAERESGLYPWAYNTSSGCMGLFQHIEWAGRRWMLRPAWFRKPLDDVTWTDPRANAIMAARMVAGAGAWSGGWGPWSL